MYQFKDEETGEIIEVDFATAMTKDVTGAIEVGGRRYRHVIEKRDTLSPRQRELNHQIPPSDALGVTARQVESFREDARKAGFTGVEFVQDPHEPTFYQCKVSGRERDRYIDYRGYTDNNRTQGAALSPGMLERAAEMVKRLERE